MSKIIRLTAENVKRLSAVTIKPDGNIVVIGGKNGQGKSSCLDAIEYALGGDPKSKMPVRRGEDRARVVVDLGDIVVRRTFTAAGGTSLVVTNADGVKQMSPQSILDKLVGKLTFDPLEFSRQKPSVQAETMRQIVGLDFSKIEEERDRCYNERTSVNRDAKELEGRMKAMPKHEGLPESAVSAAEVLTQQSAAAKQNALNAATRQQAKEASVTAENYRDKIELHTARIAEIEVEIAKLQAHAKNLAEQRDAGRAGAKKAMEDASKMVEQASMLKDIDLEPFKVKIAECEETNRKIRENNTRAEVVKQYRAKSEAAEKLTARIESLDSSKRKAVTESKYPVEGLAFDAAGGVTLNGIPFEQCSSAEQLRVSVAVGLALNPKLKVLLIRDGSLLDDDSMKLLLDMAEKADAQVWIERVAVDATTSVIIEDGHVQGVEPPKPEETPVAASEPEPAPKGMVVENGVLL